MSDGKNPCDVCSTKNKASGCSNCVLDEIKTGECLNYDCFVNYECGCLLGLDNVCKASTVYEDDVMNHTCDECGYYEEADACYCRKNGGPPDEWDEVGGYDTACEDFKERSYGQSDQQA